MRLLKPLLPLLALSALAACATPAPVSTSMADAGAPAPTPNYDWFLNQDARENTLAYGVANSDEVKLKLFCGSGSGALDLAAVLEKPSRQLHLESGGDTERYRASSEPAGVHDGELLTAQATTKDPVFQRFRRLGWIASWSDEERHIYAAHPAAKAGIEQFFTVCG